MNILITGSVAFDYLMTFPGEFKENILADQLESISLSFLVDSLIVRRGGVAPNIAYTMALLGQKPRVMATVGTDFGEYRIWLEEIGVDTSAMVEIQGKHTASFFVTTDRNNAQIASFYPGAMGYAGKLSLQDLQIKPDLVIVSPNSPDAMDKIIAECKELDILYLYDPGQQVARVDGDVLRAGIDGAWALFVNEYEIGLIQKKTGLSDRELLEKIPLTVITKGAKGLTVISPTEIVDIPAVPAKEVRDPTGGGDAFRGGFLTGYSHGFDWTTCARIGVLAATYCLEAEGPQGHKYSIEEFIRRFREHFGDANLIDNLLK
jgi:adenosine kinase